MKSVGEIFSTLRALHRVPSSGPLPLSLFAAHYPHLPSPTTSHFSFGLLSPACCPLSRQRLFICPPPSQPVLESGWCGITDRTTSYLPTHRTALTAADASSPQHTSSLLLAIDSFPFFGHAPAPAIRIPFFPAAFWAPLTQGAAVSTAYYPVIHAFPLPRRESREEQEADTTATTTTSRGRPCKIDSRKRQVDHSLSRRRSQHFRSLYRVRMQ